jgi:predicted secreted Zn-dependent protease
MRWLMIVGRLALVFVVGFVVRHYGYSLSRPASGFPQSTDSPLQSGDSADIPAVSDIPDVQVAYYAVDASDVAGIRAEMNAKRPHDSGGDRFDALSNWNYRWHWDAPSDGSCGNSNAVVDFDARIILPRLSHPEALSPEAAARWNAYMAALTKHQANQLRQAYGGRQWVANEVRNAACENANEAGTRAAADISAQIQAYDASTNHGAAEGAVFG